MPCGYAQAMIDIDRWQNLDPNSPYSAGSACTRLGHLFRRDPFVQMLTAKVTDALLVAMFDDNGIGLAEGDQLRVHAPADIAPLVARVFAVSPLALVNDQFVAYVAGLTSQAIFPKG
jgi:hypothetical protein